MATLQHIAQRGEQHGRTLSLPRVNVGGVSAEELVTPLGTVIRFERGGVSYVVIGSVPKSTAEAAARGLVPSVRQELAIKTFAANRPASISGETDSIATRFRPAASGPGRAGGWAGVVGLRLTGARATVQSY